MDFPGFTEPFLSMKLQRTGEGEILRLEAEPEKAESSIY